MSLDCLEAGMGWHTLRHTYRTLHAEAGTPVEVVKSLMRHASITTLFDTYGDSVPESMRVASRNVVAMVPKKKRA